MGWGGLGWQAHKGWMRGGRAAPDARAAATTAASEGRAKPKSPTPWASPWALKLLGQLCRGRGRGQGAGML